MLRMQQIYAYKNMNKIINQIVKGKHNRDFALDLYLPEGNPPSKGWPILIFAHGFKGFKDWGHWYKIAEKFAENSFAFLKFNFAFNGTTIQQPTDFADLEAFGQNNFSKELADMQSVLDWLNDTASSFSIDLDNITLIGHSRGGPIALLTAAKSAHIRSVITWASVPELDSTWQSFADLKTWETDGVVYVANARTGEQMPIYYQLYEDFRLHVEEYSVKNALAAFQKPMLIVHGDLDPAVKPSAAEYLKRLVPHADYKIIADANHVFGGHHPFPPENPLPLHSEELIQVCLEFLKQ